MASNRPPHQSVLLTEAIDALAVREGGRYVDCTLGRGGHTEAIIGRGGNVLAFDADPEALAKTVTSATVVNANFSELESILREYDFIPVDGVLFDLGVSSPQLDTPERGFSLRSDGPLDMRFNPNEGPTAASLVNGMTVDELAGIFKELGEEPQARKMARAIDQARRESPILTTLQLARTIEHAAGGRGRIHPATRIFQALRIAVNRELDRLSLALHQALVVLAQGGRLVVISFHSLEDRIVKEFFATESRDCICPPRVPVCICGHKATLKVLSRKPIVPGEAELRTNPRARSAKLRVAERR